MRPTENEQKAAYARLERAVRKATGCRLQDLDRLHGAFTAAVPEAHRAAFSKAFTAYHEARIEQLVTTQQAAYVLGIVVGQTLRRRDEDF